MFNGKAFYFCRLIINRGALKRRLRIVRYIIYKETLIDQKEHFWTFCGGFVGIGLIGYLQQWSFSPTDNVFLIGSFGASAVLVFGLINSPLAQPRNLVGGHLISALAGVMVVQAVPDILWLQASVAVPLSIVLMQMTKTLHPPGGATALIAVIGSGQIRSLGYWYVLSPVFSGVAIMLVTALIFNNMTSNRSYPNNKDWFKVWKRRYR